MQKPYEGKSNRLLKKSPVSVSSKKRPQKTLLWISLLPVTDFKRPKQERTLSGWILLPAASRQSCQPSRNILLTPARGQFRIPVRRHSSWQIPLKWPRNRPGAHSIQSWHWWEPATMFPHNSFGVELRHILFVTTDFISQEFCVFIFS